MKKIMELKIFYFLGCSLLISGCASVTLTEQVLGVIPNTYEQKEYTNAVDIVFSSDKKYESEKGVPLRGQPVICSDQGVSNVPVANGLDTNPISVPAGEEVIVTSIIRWYNGGWEKTCAPFVSFIPESGSSYAVVNERIGGKGVSALWTGVAFQSCKISVYNINSDSPEKVYTEEVSLQSCKAKTGSN